MNKDELIAIGAIAGVHGIKGEVKVVFHGQGPFEWKSVYVGKNPADAVRFTVSRARSHKGAYIIGSGVSTRDARTKGGAIFIEREFASCRKAVLLQRPYRHRGYDRRGGASEK